MSFSRIPFSRLFAASMMIVGLLLATVAFSPGCVSDEEYSSAREREVEKKTALEDQAKKSEEAIARLNATISALEAKKAELETKVEALAEGSKEREQAEAILADFGKKIRELDDPIREATAAATEARATAKAIGENVAKADGIKADASKEANPGTAVGGLVGALIPGAATIAPLLLGSLWKNLRDSQAKRALATDNARKTTAIDRIVASIEAVSKISGTFKSELERNAPLLDVVQTPIGKAEVDRAQAGMTASPIALPPTVVAVS